jgi:putative endonuclease
VTSDLEQRISQHKHKTMPGFTARYNINQLVRYEEYPTAISAIEREKQLKGWTRAKKIALIESENPRWEDLAADWEWTVRHA